MFKRNLLEELTLIIIPNSSRRTINFRINQKIIITSILIITVFLLYFAYLSYKYYASKSDFDNISKIKEESQSKDRTIEMLNKELEKLQTHQFEIEQKQEQLKKMMGIKNTEIPKSKNEFTGQGGEDIANVADLDYYYTYMDTIETTNLELDEMFKLLEGKQEYYRHMPNQWPAQGEITSNYGMRKSPFGGNKHSFHDGVDIANQSGTPIIAAADGTVIFAGYMPVYGKTILIEHSSLYTTKYGHNSVLLIKEGEEVKKGQIIAKMGNTGRSTGPHLHFTIYKNGQTQNPLLYLP